MRSDSTKKMRRRRFADVCKKDSKPGFVLDTAVPISNKTVKMATQELHMKVRKCITELEAGRERKMKQFFIGKTFLGQNEDYTFDPTLKLTGIPENCEKYFEEDYCNDGVLVLATVTIDSIPEDCRKSWYIRRAEEYAQILETRMIATFAEKDQRLVKGTTGLSEQESNVPNVYLIFMAFTMEGM